MALTAEESREYEAHRLEMNKINHDMRLIFWGHIILVAVFLVMIFIVGITETKNHEGAAIWYYSMESAALEAFCAIVSLAFALLSGIRKRLPALGMLAFYALLAILAIVHVPTTLSIGNVIPAAIGIGLNGWRLWHILRLEQLSECPGYPLFSEHASEPAHYESLYHVSRAQSRDSAMQDTRPEGRPLFEDDRPQDGSVSEASLGLGAMDDSLPVQSGRKETIAAADVALDGMGEAAVSGRTELQPTASAEVLLSDMSAEGSAKKKQYAPDAEALPTPEEVRARLAAMKKAQQGQVPPQ